MASLTLPAGEDGLMVAVVVGLDGATTTDLLARGLPISAPVSCRGLIDTGSTATSVASSILKQLGVGPDISGSKNSQRLPGLAFA